jgi:hypothetical protein
VIPRKHLQTLVWLSLYLCLNTVWQTIPMIPFMANVTHPTFCMTNLTDNTDISVTLNLLFRCFFRFLDCTVHNNDLIVLHQTYVFVSGTFGGSTYMKATSVDDGGLLISCSIACDRQQRFYSFLTYWTSTIEGCSYSGTHHLSA